MRKVIVTVFILLFMAACGTKESVLPPQAIQAGIDRCDHCNMLVPDDHNATQLILKDGRSLKFDDIGCMVQWAIDNGMDDVNVRYVRDYHSNEWVIFEQASFAYHKEFRTPMAYGIFSFATREAAENFVAEHGKGHVLSYQDLQGHPWERDMELMKQMKEEMGHHHHGHGNDHDGEEEMDHDHDHEEEEEHSHGHDKKEKEKKHNH